MSYRCSPRCVASTLYLEGPYLEEQAARPALIAFELAEGLADRDNFVVYSQPFIRQRTPEQTTHVSVRMNLRTSCPWILSPGWIEQVHSEHVFTFLRV